MFILYWIIATVFIFLVMFMALPFLLMGIYSLVDKLTSRLEPEEKDVLGGIVFAVGVSVLIAYLLVSSFLS